MARRSMPVGVILAGGGGRRIGGSKATVRLGGKPLISYPLEAMSLVLSEVVVIAKPDTELPSLPGVTVWVEPATPQHPLVGITNALAFARSRSVLVCAGDLPFVTPELIVALATADTGDAPAVIASRAGHIQPLLGCYEPLAADLLATAATTADRPTREAVIAIGPRLLEVEDPDALFNVNAPDDLFLAAAMLDRRRGARIG